MPMFAIVPLKLHMSLSF